MSKKSERRAEAGRSESGGKESAAILSEKQKRVLDGKRQMMSQKKGGFTWKVMLILLVAVALPVSWWILKEDSQGGPGKPQGSQVAGKVNYQNQSVSMTKVAAVIQQGSIDIPLETVKEKKLVLFEYDKGGAKTPLLAYISPSGKLVTAVSVCEPCNSNRFHIEGSHLVCNTCFTRWDLETLKGISGGCLAYPPDVLPHTVQDGKVQIPEKEVQGWKPRVFKG